MKTLAYFVSFMVLTGANTLSFARNDSFSRGFGVRQSDGPAAATAGSARSYTPAPSAPRALSAPTPSFRSDAVRAPSMSASAPAFAPRSYSPAQTAPTPRPPSSFSGGTPRIQAPPTFTTPRAQSATRPQTEYRPTQAERAETLARPYVAGSAPSHTMRAPTALPSTSQAAPAGPRTVTPQTQPPNVLADDRARSFGTPRSLAPQQPADSLPPVPQTQSRTTDFRRPSTTPLPERPSEALSPGNMRGVSRTEAPSRAATPSAAPLAPPSTGRTAGGLGTGLGSPAPRARANSISLPRPTGDRLLTTSPSRYSSSPLRLGTAGLSRSSPGAGETAALTPALSLRSPRDGAPSDLFGRVARTTPSMRTAPPANALGKLPASLSRDSGRVHRYGPDGRTLYSPPFGSTDRQHQPSYSPRYSGHYASHNNRHHDDHYNSHHGSHHYDSHHHSHYSCHPVWWGPVVYPAGFGMTWCGGSFALSVATYAPACSYRRYYDSWHCGGWGYTSVYYGGWCDNWYGGFSYVYNPWPVYRTYYLYEPYPVVTRTETVYVTETAPATAPQPAAYTSYEAAPQAYAAAPAASYVAAPPPPAPSPAWEEAPAVQQAEAAATSCFCPCQCNGTRPCTCDYPCGAEYALRDEEFDLGLAFISYADTLSPERIWSSYAGLDRWDTSSGSLTTDAFVANEDRAF